MQLLRTLLILLLLIITTVCLSTYFSFTTERGRIKIVDYVLHQLNKTGVSITYDGLQNKTVGNVRIRTLTIKGNNNQFVITNLSMQWDYHALYSRKLKINKITASQIVWTELGDAPVTNDIPEEKPVDTAAKNKKSSGFAIDIDEFSANLQHGKDVSAFSGKLLVDSDSIDADVDVTDLPIDFISKFNSDIPPRLEGKISMKGTLEGSLQNPDAKGMLDFTGSFRDIPLSISAEGVKSGSELNIKLMEVRSFYNSYLSASGTLNQKNFDFNVMSKSIPGEILELVGLKLSDTTFSSNLKINGTMQSPTIAGDINITTNTKNFAGMTPKIVTLTSILKTQANIITAETSINDDTGTIGKLYASISNKLYVDGNFTPNTLTLKGTSQIAALLSLLDYNNSLALDGQVYFDSTISNLSETPSLNGVLKVTNGSLAIAETGAKISNLTFVVISDGTNIKIQKGSAADSEKGSVTFVGEAAINSPFKQSTLNIDVTSKNLNIVKKDEATAYATGDINLNGTVEKMLAKGSLDVYPLNLYPENIDMKNIKLGTSATPKVVANAPAAVTKKSPIDVNIDVNVKNGLIASTHAKGDINGKINTSGNTSDLLYNGDLNITKGEVEILNKKFEISKGKILFAGKDILLDVVADYPMKDRKIIASITGNKNQPVISVTTDPPTKADSVISLFNVGEKGVGINKENLGTAINNMLEKKKGKIDSIGKGIMNSKFGTAAGSLLGIAPTPAVRPVVASPAPSTSPAPVSAQAPGSISTPAPVTGPMPAAALPATAPAPASIAPIAAPTPAQPAPQPAALAPTTQPAAAIQPAPASLPQPAVVEQPETVVPAIAPASYNAVQPDPAAQQIPASQQ